MRVMKVTKLLIKVVFLAIFVSKSSFAERITVVGSIEQIIKQSNLDSTSKPLILNIENKEKTIQLLRVELSDEEKERLASRAKDALKELKQLSILAQNTESMLAGGKYQAGMNKVPVLDQGRHGTCALFAVTGAIDASLGKGDYVSQICSLQLGSYLQKHGYGLSGWNGAYVISTIQRIEAYGIVNQKNQKKLGCGGLTKYPAYFQPNENAMMDPEEFSAKSEPVFGATVNWSDVFHAQDPVSTLNEVKEAIQKRDRLVMAFLIPNPGLGSVGAVGKYKTWIYPDTWLLTADVLHDVKKARAAHAIIITGYDDEAVAVDNKGHKHKGLLTLRNSWGGYAGNNGDFYMTYDYFKLLAFELHRISSTEI